MNTTRASGFVGLLLSLMAGAAHAHELPLATQPELWSPAALHAVEVRELQFHSHTLTYTERATFDAGEVSLASKTQTLGLLWTKAASPSLSWRLRLGHARGESEARHSLLTADRPQSTDRQLTRFSPEASFKIMDRLVVGLGLHGQQTKQTFRDTQASRSDIRGSQGLLLKFEGLEFGWAQELNLQAKHAADQRRIPHETRLHGQIELGADHRLSMLMRRNPQSLCCPGTEREMEWTLALLSRHQPLHSVAAYSYSPKSAKVPYSAPSHTLSASLGYQWNAAWALTADAYYVHGETKGADVEITTALTRVEKADVRVRGFGAGLAIHYRP